MTLVLRCTTVISRSAIAVAALSLAFLAGSHMAYAQTQYRTSFDLSATNYEDRDTIGHRVYGFTEFGGAALSSSGEVKYSFGPNSGTSLGAASDTIRFAGNGFASANGLGFTDLKASVRSTLQNAYLDLRDIRNAPNNDGMKAPYLWSASAQAGWTLTSRFQTALPFNNSYTVKWIFIVDGVENTSDSRLGTANLSFAYAGNPTSFFTTNDLGPEIWATPSMPVQWGQGVVTRADFVTNWNYSLLTEASEVYQTGDEEGAESTLVGYVAPTTLNATVDYASTVKLDEIQVFDENGNRFYDFTVDDGNGTQYYNGRADASVAAPEPGTLLLIGCVFSLLPIARRRRQARCGTRNASNRP